jgi:hypothetical protein
MFQLNMQIIYLEIDILFVYLYLFYSPIVYS